MRRLLAAATLSGTLSLAAGLACGDSTGVQPEDLAGTWVATSVTFTSQADPTQSIELISQGFSFSIEIESDGSVTTTFTDPGGGTDTDTGTFEVNGANVTLDTDEPATGTITRTGDTLTVELTNGVEFDVNGDGSDEPATLVLVLEKS